MDRRYRITRWIVGLLWLTFCLVAMMSCTTDDIEPDDVDRGEAYFPVTVGNWKEYEVEETIYTLLDTFYTNYLLREELVQPTGAPLEEPTVLLYRYYRDDASDPWDLDSLWQVKLLSTKRTTVENNIRYVRLAFPLEEGIQWDGNAENALGFEQYTAKDFGDAFTVPVTGLSFGDAVKIEHAVDTLSIIIDEVRFEVYARNVGLVYIYEENTDTQPGFPPVGTIYEQRITGYGP